MQSKDLLLCVLVVLVGHPASGHECEEATIINRASVWYELHAPISDDFRDALDKRTSENLAAWSEEIDRSYHTDGRLVYRGVCDDAGRTVADFLHIFVSVGEELLSRQSGNSFHAAKPGVGDFDLRRSINADLSRFNHDAFMFSLYQEALVHQKGPVGDNTKTYEDSYGFSTSGSFWMAAEFAGVYPGEKACSNSMVFGLIPARHYLDYATLEEVDTRFKRLFPDERESLGAGAVDPDSVMLVARLETRPDKEAPVITEVMLRDPQVPGQVQYFRGAIDVFEREVNAGWDSYLRDERETEEAIRKYGVDPQTPPTVPVDSVFRIHPGEPLTVNKAGHPAKPETVYQLVYEGPVYPQPAAPSKQE